MAQVAVIGGGISGLACVHRLLELKKEKNFPALEILLLEAGGRLGGIIQTEKKEGFVLEDGPDAFISEKPAALELCKRLEIEDRLIETEKKNRKSFIVRGGKLLPVPEGFYLIAPTKLGPFLASPILSLPGKIRTLLEPFLKPSVSQKDESVGAFIRRRFGAEMLERVGQAMLAGIYTADPESLSLKAALPRFAELESKYGSVIRGLKEDARKKDSALRQVSGPRYSLFMSFKEGMQTLPDTIAAKIPQECLRLGFTARTLAYDAATRTWAVTSQNGEKITAAAVCLATSPRAASMLTDGTSADLSEKLGSITSESVATIYFAYPDSRIPKRLDGFGFVVPATENRPLIACSFTSNKFLGRAPKGFTLLRAFAGGAFGKKIYDLSEADLSEAVRRDLSELLGIRSKPYFSHFKRHPHSVIQYRVGHLDLVSAIRNACGRFEGLFVTGAAYHGVGIPDCIEDARNQAELIFKKVTT